VENLYGLLHERKRPLLIELMAATITDPMHFPRSDFYELGLWPTQCH
jgi:hypothetical protein